MAIYNKLDPTKVVTQQEFPIFGKGRLAVYKRRHGSCSYQITDHLGNVKAVVQKGNSQPISVTDYYSFGEQLPSRTNGNDLCRYAFQGQELDKETIMEAFQLRLWDGRIGRWLSVDPAGEFYSPYLGMGNNRISLTHPTGATTDCCGPGEGTSTGNMQYSDENGNPTGVDKPATNLAQIVIIGPPKSTAYKLADTLTDFVPVVGGAKDIYRGWKSGNPWQVAMGVGFIAFDLATLGSGSLIRGGVKTAMKVGTKELAEEGVEQVAKTSFRSFSSFKRAYGTAGKGNAWHDIVEQNKSNISKFGAEIIHNIENLKVLPHGKGSVHAKISGYYSSLMPGTNMRVRDYVNTLSYDEQYKFGIDVIKRFGGTLNKNNGRYKDKIFS